VLAAIFMALHEEQEVVHDYENTVLTMDRVIRNYSPWNSKLYGLRQPLAGNNGNKKLTVMSK